MIEADRRAGARRSPRSSRARASSTPRASTRTSSSASASGTAQAAIFAMRDDAKNLYAAAAREAPRRRPSRSRRPRRHLRSRSSSAAGVDVAINPRMVTAEEIVRFAHDPRTQQMAMLEGDRYEILDITVRRRARSSGKPFNELPMTGALIGAIIRDGTAIFPHGEDVLLPATGRSSSRSPRASPRSSGPCDALLARLAERAPAHRLGVDVRGALNLVGALVKYLSLAYLLPAAFALGYGEPVWPFLAAGGIAAACRARRSSSSTRGRGSVGAARGLPGRRAHLAPRGRRSAPSRTCSRGEAQLAQPDRRLLRGHVRLHHDRRHRAHRRPEPRPLARSSGGSSPSGSAAWGSSCSRWPSCPGCASAAASCSSHELPGPEIEQLAASIRETARRLWLLYVGLTGADGRSC